MTASQALKHIVQPLLEIYDPGESVSIAAIVLEDAFGIPPNQISKDKKLDSEQTARLDSILQRLLAHEPVQYVMGQAVFYGLRFKVTPAVLIPRQETEESVHWVLETAKANPAIRSILDIGTGSGCIPVSIKKKRPDLQLHALDVSTEALEIAAENAHANGTEVQFHQVDILDKKAWKTLPRFDLIVSNPPYVTQKERLILPKNVIDFEPHLALFSGGNDAQRFVKKIADFGIRHLNPGGWLFLETNEFYVPRSAEILAKKGYVEIETKKDLNKKDRMICGRRPGEL
ncbi:MAG: peptide chain release factor N(5)-glutamine methyltransferase [Bacteroidetes bacterium]|nr:peptide chain release factor N(5)-glutamine methyltransferase [Bacteroidota bacterium]